MKVVLRQTQFDHEPVRRAIFHRIEWSSSCTWGMALHEKWKLWPER